MANMDYDRNNKPVELAVEIPQTKETVIEYIKEKLDCPLPIRETERFYELKDNLIGLWMRIARKYSVVDEFKHIYYSDEDRDFELEDDMLDELTTIARNLSTWIDTARADFLRLTDHISALVADKAVYPKHILRRNATINEITDIIKSEKASILYSDMSPSVLSEIILRSANVFFDEIIKQDRIKFSVVCNRNVGVTKTFIVTNCLMVDIQRTKLDDANSVAHGYPCTLEEAKNNVGSYTIKNSEMCAYDDCEDIDPNAEQTITLCTSYDFD